MPVTAFLGERAIAAGNRDEVTRQIEDGYALDTGSILVFDDLTGRAVDLCYWAARDCVEEFSAPMSCEIVDLKLLPRHWHWLNSQPRGAAATVRRLIEAAMIEPVSSEAQVAPAYHFMVAMCGNRPNYEEALRALYRFELRRFRQLIASWPDDIASYLARLIEAAPAKPDTTASN